MKITYTGYWYDSTLCNENTQKQLNMLIKTSWIQTHDCERKWILCTWRDRFYPKGNFICFFFLLALYWYFVVVWFFALLKWQITIFSIARYWDTLFVNISFLCIRKVDLFLVEWHVSSVTYWISDALDWVIWVNYIMGMM